MMEQEEIEAKIIAYLSGELSDVERESFELEINESPELQKLVEDQRMIDSLFIDAEDWTLTEYNGKTQKQQDYFEFFKKEENKDFYDSLKVISPQTEAVKRKIGATQLIKLFSAAAVIALLAIAVFTIKNYTQDKNLYSRYVDYESLESFTEKGQESAFAEAERSFREKDYQLADTQFENIEKRGEASSLSTIYHVLALAELNRYEEAQEKLTPILKNADSIHQIEAYWYSALIAVKAGDLEDAKEKLNYYIEKDISTERVEKAKKLLKQIS